jgi:DNA topoisomerase-3
MGNERSQYKGEVQRLWISSLTTEAMLFQQFKTLPANYDNLYYAGFEPLVTGCLA